MIRVFCDLQRPVAGVDGERWAQVVERAVDRFIEQCVDLDPARGVSGRVRGSDGRSEWIEPVAAHITSEEILAQEEAILTWALDADSVDLQPSLTVRTEGLDVLQRDAAAAVAGHDPLVLVVGPAGTGKTTMLRAAVTDLHGQDRPVYGVSPTAKAARTLERETGMRCDTVAKLLHEWGQPDRSPDHEWRLARGTTLIVDEASMLGTPSLHHHHKDEQRRARDLDQQVKDAQRQLRVVEQYARPFADAATAAETALTAAKDCRHLLAEQLATAKRRDRRVLEPALENAEHDIETATGIRDQAVTDAKPAQTLTAQAKVGLRDLRDEQSRQRVYGQWRSGPETISILQDRVDALDTWRQWANGHQLTPTRIKEMNARLFVANDTTPEYLALRTALFHDRTTATIVRRVDRGIERSRGPELSMD